MSRPLRSATSTQGRNMAGARALWRATGMTDGDFGKPIIAIANSFDEFLPGHVHLNKVGRIVSEAIREAGGIPREFNTMAVDDGIAMGHVGMKYSLVTRDLIADSTEAMVMAHQFDGLVMIPNCDKNVPGLLMAAARLNIPTCLRRWGRITPESWTRPGWRITRKTPVPPAAPAPVCTPPTP